MKEIIRKINKWLCKRLGHSFNSTELLILDILQNDAINKKDFAGRAIICKRCGTPCSFVEVVGLYENPAEFEL